MVCTTADNLIISTNIKIAKTFFTRFKGLMLRKALSPGEALLLKDCPAIHCCFMRFDIDVVYLSEDYTVLAKETVKPWRIGKNVKGAQHVLEMDAGTARKIELGSKLTFKEFN